MIVLPDALRAGLIAVVAVAMAFALRSLAATGRRWAWGLMLAPYIVPSLLVGYAYSNFALSLVHYSALNTGWYSVLLAMKLAPVAAVALLFSPRPLSAAALHCRKLAHGSVGWRFRWEAGCARAPLAAFALVYLLAFGEFEMASLMNIKTWPVRLFDGHAGGLPIARSVTLVAAPFVVQMFLLGAMLLLLARQNWEGGEGAPPVLAAPRDRGSRPGGAASGVAAWGVLVAANLAVCVVPAVIVLKGAIQGFGVLAENFVLGREVVASLLFGLVAAGAAYALAPRGPWRAVILCVPGLSGGLVLALLMGAAIQGEWLHRLRDTPVPLTVTLVLLLLPTAVLLRYVLRGTAPRPAIHLARLLRNAAGARLLWILSVRRHVWALFLLVSWGYLELTASAILAPVGIAPVSVRLYNLMHYGQTAVLSAMVAVTFAAPWLVLAIAMACRRLWVRL